MVHTAPLLNKLDVHAGMGVAEVWIFKEGAFRVYLLDRALGSSSRRGMEMLYR